MHLLRGISKTQMARSRLKALQGSRRWISSKRKGLIGFGFHHLYLLSHVGRVKYLQIGTADSS